VQERGGAARGGTPPPVLLSLPEREAWLPIEGEQLFGLDEVDAGAVQPVLQRDDGGPRDGAGRSWRIAYTCGSLAGAHAAVRAGLGVSLLPRNMVPADLAILDTGGLGLPDLAETEMALIAAPGLGPAALRLRQTISRELEGTASAGRA
jgi:DNA-binding transcriptional LysR family regulator